MKNFLQIFTCGVITISLLGGTLAFAQAPTPTPGVIVANINLSNITIVSQTPTEIRIGLDIVNNGDTTQSDIKYGVDLVKKSATVSSLADTFTATETLIVPAKQTLHHEFTYPVPPTLSGTYTLMVISRATSGMMLGLGSPGTVALTGSTENVEITPETCYATVGAEKTHYTLQQGVDVKSEEVLTLSCTATNHFPRSVTVTPTFKTYERTTYGTLVAMTYPASAEITFTKNEKKTISVTIPKPDKSQAYDVSMTLTEKAQTIPVSGAITLHYVVAGESATIQNTSLDKTLYAKGEIITATLNWSPSANMFPGSRTGKKTDALETIATITITDGSGVSCASPITQKLSQTKTLVALTTNALIDCANPVASVVLTDNVGKVFDARTFSSGTKEIAPPPTPVVIADESLVAQFSRNTLLVAGVLGILLIGIVLLWRRKMVPTNEVMRSFLLVLMLSLSFLVGAGKAEAISFTGYDADGTPTVYTINTDKSSYAPGETISMYEYAYFPTCGNAHTVTYIETLNGNSVTSYTLSGVTDTTAYLPIPGTTPPGNYDINVQVFFEDTRGPNQGYTTITIPITIVSTNNPPTATITVPTTNITLNQHTNTTMTGSGSDPDAGDSITAYEWRESSCSAGALLSTLSSFSLTNPVAGVRNIYLRVKDAHNTWSTNCPSRQITVSTCSALAGNACASPANSCGTTNTGTIQCDGSCSATTAPPNPVLYGQSCASAQNICGQTNIGAYNCSGSCDAAVPPASGCPAPSCGNGICEGWSATPETLLTCPQDCKMKVDQF